MDLHTVNRVLRPASAKEIASWDAGFAWLAGGTWLFSEPQLDVHTLIDLESLKWPALQPSEDGLEIASTCRVVELDQLVDKASPDWTAAPLFRLCCRSFLASFKIWNEATVGGNICMSLPAGPMITLSVALEATYRLLRADGSERTVPAIDFVTGNHANILDPGEVLRRIDIPADALRKRHAHRRFTLTHLGRSTIFMIATQRPGADDLLLTITAGTTRPVRLAFDTMPDADSLQYRIDMLPDDLWFDDPNGTPDHRRHLAKHYAEEIRVELNTEDRS
jgi:CO/xanthine dehydrogenase FAD-binding subunit